MKASDLFVKQLEEEGVEYIFGLPGEENLDFLESLRTSTIKVIITRHEQTAAFMAATYGRLTGKAGVCFSTLGPGATNLVTGVAHAQLIGAPLVSISGQKALRENRQARFQLIDIVSLMRPITKDAVSIVDPGMIPTVLRNAFKLAQAERPGAVHLELPEDVAESETDAQVQKRGLCAQVRARRQGAHARRRSDQQGEEPAHHPVIRSEPEPDHEAADAVHREDRHLRRAYPDGQGRAER